MARRREQLPAAVSSNDFFFFTGASAFGSIAASSSAFVLSAVVGFFTTTSAFGFVFASASTFDFSGTTSFMDSCMARRREEQPPTGALSKLRLVFFFAGTSAFVLTAAFSSTFGFSGVVRLFRRRLMTFTLGAMGDNGEDDDSEEEDDDEEEAAVELVVEEEDEEEEFVAVVEVEAVETFSDEDVGDAGDEDDVEEEEEEGVLLHFDFRWRRTPLPDILPKRNAYSLLRAYPGGDKMRLI
jgi:hypothetical protein